MQNIVKTALEFLLRNLKTVIASLITLVLGAILGSGFTRKRDEKKLMQVKEALRKDSAKLAALEESEKQDKRQIKKLKAQIEAHQRLIIELEDKLAQQ